MAAEVLTQLPVPATENRPALRAAVRNLRFVHEQMDHLPAIPVEGKTDLQLLEEARAEHNVVMKKRPVAVIAALVLAAVLVLLAGVDVQRSAARTIVLPITVNTAP